MQIAFAVQSQTRSNKQHEGTNSVLKNKQSFTLTSCNDPHSQCATGPQRQHAKSRILCQTSCDTRARAATASRAYPAHTKRPRFSASANVRALQLSCKQTLSTQTGTNEQTRISSHGCTSSYFSATLAIFVIHTHPHSTIAKILHILDKEVFGNLPAGANVSGELADAEWNHFNAVDASSLQRNNLGEKQLHGTLQIARLPKDQITE